MKFVIDSNIIVHWMMGESILDYVVKEKKLSEEFKEVYLDRYEKSIKFIIHLLSDNNITDKNSFSIIEFSLNEIFSGVREEVRTILMLNRGIPLSRWNSRRETKDIKIPMDVGEEIYENILKGFDKLFENDIIGIIPTATPLDFPDYFDLYSSLLFYNSELTTQDAVLLTSAIFDDTDYFVTLDGVLVNMSRTLRDKYKIRIIRPDKALNIITKGARGGREKRKK